MNMEIEHYNEATKGHFKAIELKIRAGFMTYTWAGTDRFIIDHTEVNSDFKGRGIGKLMLLKAVDFAREKQVNIIPLCPFAKSVFDKMPELRDVL